MLREVIDIVNSSVHHIQDGTLFCENYIITDVNLIEWLEEQNILENTPNSKKIGTSNNIELSLPRLNSIGFYEDTNCFVLKNKYALPAIPYYIEEIKCYGTDSNEFINKYLTVVVLINSIKNIARHNYTDIDLDNSLIYRDDKALLLSFLYEAVDIHRIPNDNIDKINRLQRILTDGDSREKWIFINELIDFLTSEEENNRFKFLLDNIKNFVDRATNAYQYYIRNFSYNKLKTELDNAALDYSKKIQSVINDAQTKLIAIPTAFVLAIANINFDQIINNKNIGIVSGLFIFSWLIDLFIKNQKSVLKFIHNNVTQYKSTFSPQQNEIVSDSFATVDKEIRKQKNRINIIHWITWGLPIILTITLVIINIKN